MSVINVNYVSETPIDAVSLSTTSNDVECTDDFSYLSIGVDSNEGYSNERCVTQGEVEKFSVCDHSSEKGDVTQLDDVDTATVITDVMHEVNTCCFDETVLYKNSVCEYYNMQYIYVGFILSEIGLNI